MKLVFRTQRGIPSEGCFVLFLADFSAMHSLTFIESISPTGQAKCPLGTIKFPEGHVSFPGYALSMLEYGFFRDLPSKLVRAIKQGPEQVKELRRSGMLSMTGTDQIEVDLRFFLGEDGSYVLNAIEEIKDVVSNCLDSFEPEDKDELLSTLFG